MTNFIKNHGIAVLLFVILAAAMGWFYIEFKPTQKVKKSTKQVLIDGSTANATHIYKLMVAEKGDTSFYQGKAWVLAMPDIDTTVVALKIYDKYGDLKFSYQK